MGNLKSKHIEKLDENDEKYYARFRKRNATSSPKKSKKRFCFSEKRVLSHDKNGIAVVSFAEGGSSPRIGAQPTAQSYIFPTPGPLQENTNLNVPTLNKTPKKKKKKKNFTTKSPSKYNLPSSPLDSKIPNITSNYNELYSAKVISTRREKKAPFVDDYYADMIAEANSSCASTRNSTSSLQIKDFESSLNSGVIWEEFQRGSKITACALSPALPPENIKPTESHDCGELVKRWPIFLAVGCDDGSLSVVEILDHAKHFNRDSLVTSNAVHNNSVNFTSSTGNSKTKGKFGAVREIPRDGKIRSLDFSNNGKYLLVGGDDCTCVVVDLGWNEEVITSYTENNDAPYVGINGLLPLKIVTELEREDRVYTNKWSPCDSMIAVGGFDGMTAIASFSPPKGECSAQVDLINEISSTGLILCLDWSCDGSKLAIGGSNRSVAIINVRETTSDSDKITVSTQDEELIRSWELIGKIQRTASIQTLQWSPDSSRLAMGEQNGITTIVEISTRSILKEIKRKKKRNNISRRVDSLCWSPDGLFLAIGSDHMCLLVEMKTFISVQKIRRAGNVNCVSWGHQYPSGGAAGCQYLAIGGDDQSVVLLKTGVNDDKLNGLYSYRSSELQGDGNSTVTSYMTNQTDDWTLEEGSFRDIDNGLTQEKCIDTETNVSINSVMFSCIDETTTKSEYIIISGSDCRVVVLNTDDWAVITEMHFPKAIYAMTFSNCNEHLALGGADNTVHIVSVQTWEIIKEITVSSSILSMNFSKNNERLALGLANGAMSLLNPHISSDWQVVGEMDESESPVLCLDWSRNGDFFVVGRANSISTVHDSQSIFENFFLPKAEIRTASGSPVNSVTFDSGGNFLAIGGGDWKVSIFVSKDDWALCHEIKMDGSISSVCWSSDARYLGVGGSNIRRREMVWDTTSWEPVGCLKSDIDYLKTEPDKESTSVAFSEDDQFFVVAYKSSMLKVFDTNSWEVKENIDYNLQRENESENPKKSNILLRDFANLRVEN